MAVHLVRHADSLPRHRWSDADDFRPLSERGKAEAAGIVDQFDGRPVARILSSPAVRCVTTVEPLARAFAIEVELAPTLFEGGDPYGLADEWFAEAHPEGIVLCSHGEVIPELLRILRARSVDLRGGGWGRCAKGSTWTIEDGVAVYTEPPAVPSPHRAR